MSRPVLRRTQELTIIAQDPSVNAEELAPGPRGYRVQIIDYDSSRGVLNQPLEYQLLENGAYDDPFKDVSDETLLNNAQFHAQNVYAIIMRTLARFESALGRRVGWNFQGHQLEVAPHAFADANAFYSKDAHALLFGYFPSSDGNGQWNEPSEEGDGNERRLQGREMIFTCLSHDVIVHETTHALLDGLRGRYTDPSSPEQGAFHEGFADIVALLSIFSLPAVVETIIDKHFIDEHPKRATVLASDPDSIDVGSLKVETLRKSLLTGLAEQVGRQMVEAEMVGERMGALRRSVSLTPEIYHEDSARDKDKYDDEHFRGEVLVAAIMNAFLNVWVKRLSSLGNKTMGDNRGQSGKARSALPQRDKPADSDEPTSYLDRARVVEEGAGVADYLLTMVIRAIDYSPPTDMEFCDFLSAMLTADREIRPDDSKYQFRDALRDSFRNYKIEPTSKSSDLEVGIWEPPECTLRYDRIRFESMLRDPEEMFRFIWENRKELGLGEDSYTRVISVRPSVRTNPDDGFILRETVAEYYQYLRLKASEVEDLGIGTPPDMPLDQEVLLYGGAALIFDEFGQLKFNIRNRLLNPERQTNRLKHLWKSEGAQAFVLEDTTEKRFAKMHSLRYGISLIDIDTKGTWDDDLIENYEEEDSGQENSEQEGAKEQRHDAEAVESVAPEQADAS
jgi:hypothetical protein